MQWVGGGGGSLSRRNVLTELNIHVGFQFFQNKQERQAKSFEISCGLVKCFEIPLIQPNPFTTLYLVIVTTIRLKNSAGGFNFTKLRYMHMQHCWALPKALAGKCEILRPSWAWKEAPSVSQHCTGTMQRSRHGTCPTSIKQVSWICPCLPCEPTFDYFIYK